MTIKNNMKYLEKVIEEKTKVYLLSIPTSGRKL